MKQIFFFILVLSTFACQKQEVDCDNYRSNCRYIQFSFSDCTPNSSEAGWKWDVVRCDTVDFQAWGCPETIEADFYTNLQKVGAENESLRKFNEAYPSTCNCE